MSSFATELKTWLQGLGSSAGDRVYLDTAPQSAALPYVLITQGQGGSYFETLEGAAPLQEAGWHIYSFAADRQSCDDLAEVIRKQFQRYSGLIGTTYVDNVTCDNPPRGEYDKPVDNSYVPRYWALHIFQVHHSIAGI